MKVSLQEAEVLPDAMGKAWEEFCETQDIDSTDCPNLFREMFQSGWWHGANAVSEMT